MRQIMAFSRKEKQSGVACCSSFITTSCLTPLTPWTAARQASLFIGLARQEYWSGLPFPSPGDLPSTGIESASPELAGRFFTTESPGKLKLGVA